MQVTLLDKLTRLLCSNTILPLKIRSKIARNIVGNETVCKRRNFSVPFFGNTFYGSIDSHIDWYIFFFGCYDPLGLKLLRHIVRQKNNSVALDVGANAGNHAMLLANFCSQVHCFEPYPKILPQLRRNLEQNKLSNVQLHEFGLSDFTRIAEYHENVENNFGAGSFEAGHHNISPKSSFLLELKRADDVFSELGIDYFDILKIDVEGHEISVLRGMQNSIRVARPFILMEHGPTTHTNVESEKVFVDLFPYDYVFYRLTHANRWSRATPRLIPFQYGRNCNILALPREKKSVIESLVVNSR